jgi:hypothetical protein
MREVDSAESGALIAWTKPWESTSMPGRPAPPRQQHLEELAVLDGHRHVEVRDVVQRVAAVVDLEVHVEALGEMRGLDQRRDPTLDRDVPAQIVGGAGHEPGRIGREAARRVLGGEDRDVELLLELDVVVEVIVGQGSSCQ